jgi:ComF family protein
MGLFGAIADLLYPPRCLGCDGLIDLVDSAGVELFMCLECRLALWACGPLVCVRCGLPVPGPAGAAAVCGPCGVEPPPFSMARAGYVYGESIKRAVVRFKHDGVHRSARALVELCALAGAGPEALGAVDAIVPVPLFAARARRRGWNHAELLAVAVRRRLGRGPVVVPAALERVRETPVLAGLTARSRAAWLRGAIVAAPRRLEGRVVLVVDDVLTTGATASACARALLDGGASEVRVWTVARAVR